MKLSLLLMTVCGIMSQAKAQNVLTLQPNGEVKRYTSGEFKQHKDLCIDGNWMRFTDSGQVIVEQYFKNCQRDGYYKYYKNGILVELKLYQKGVPIGTHYFWDEKGILKKSITYKNGKEVASKKY